MRTKVKTNPYCSANSTFYYRSIIVALSAFLLAACGDGVGGGIEGEGEVTFQPEYGNTVSFVTDQTTVYNESAIASFNLALSQMPINGATVVFSVVHNTASASDIAFDSILTIPACSENCPASYTYTIDISDDVLDENEETFNLSIASATNLTIGSNKTISNITILEDVNDPEPTVTVGVASQAAVDKSSNSAIDFTFNRHSLE